MKITREVIPTVGIEKFADDHALTMEVHERRVDVGNPMRFYAHFERAEVKGDGVLIGTYGNGATEDEAIADYAREISLMTLVIDAMRTTRREIAVPRLAPAPTEER